MFWNYFKIFVHEPFVSPFPCRIHHSFNCQSNAFIDSVPGWADVILFPYVQFNYEHSVYGFREYFKKYGFKSLKQCFRISWRSPAELTRLTCVSPACWTSLQCHGSTMVKHIHEQIWNTMLLYITIPWQMVENMAKLFARFPLCSRVSRRIYGCFTCCISWNVWTAHYRTIWIWIQMAWISTVI
jgi:hypothetical protein